jgi:type IX secretion system PorP/SprF family membrane protein
MKKLIFTLAAVLFLLSEGNSQQVMLSSTYSYNKFIINPALTGMYRRPQLYLVHRNQWNNMPGNPTTNALTMETGMKKDKVGLGVLVFSDALGITNNVGFKATYSYRVKFGSETFLNLGLGAGVSRLGINFQDANVLDKDDLSIYNFGAINKTTFDAIGGANLTWRKLNVGFAIPNLINTKARFHKNDSLISSSSYYTYARSLAVNLGYEFNLTSDGKNVLTPLVLVKRDLVKGSRPMQIDVNLMYDYMKKYWIGAAYRTDYGIIAQAGLKMFDQFTAGYAYDFAMNNAWKGRQMVGRTHEIIVGYEFAKDKDRLDKRINKLDTAIQDNVKRTDALDSTVKDTKKKVEKMNGDLRKRDDENFQNMKKELDKTNADIEELRKQMTKDGGGTFTLTRIYFKTDRSELLPGSIAELDELVEVMTKYPNMAIKIMGHTDSRNGETYNQKLSEARAKAVYDYLVSKGIDATRLEYEGYGKKYPVADNSTESGQQMNRRVQFKITKF